MSGPPESLILQILREMRAELASKADLNVLRAEVTELRSELSDVKFDMRSLRAGVASDLLSIRRERSDQIVGLRRAVIDYHTSVTGHGVLISDIEARTRRIEQRLNLPPLGAS